MDEGRAAAAGGDPVARPGPDSSARLSHVDETGAARMVDVGDKPATVRCARAGARIWMAPATMDLLQRQALPKGDVLAVARIAGIMACKRTAELVPLCHPLGLDQADVRLTVLPDDGCVEIECSTRTEGRTGVEMEAITGASVAAITIYDMCKAVDRGMVIGDIRLLEKTGGKEDYVRVEDTGVTEGVSGPAVEGAAASTWAAETGTVSAPGAAARVISVNVSPGKGERKKAATSVLMVAEHGIEGDGHAGPWHRQVSLLAQESIDTMVAKGLDVGAGDFAENITTQGIDLPVLPIGTRLTLGPALVEVTQIGKVCHDHCAIYYQAGDCVMPREGIFVRVLEGGTVAAGDPVVVIATAGAALSGEAP
ncbi:MAG: cyclic pyranopterin monophosphate synthase MoaC [Thermoleophilia bacterium]